MVKITKKLLFLILLSFTLIFGNHAWAEWTLNMPKGVSPISRDIFDLHMFVIWVCVGIAVVVYGALIYAIIHHRKSKGAKAAKFHENTKLEIIWTIIPFILLIAMAIPATRVLERMEDTRMSDLTIKITGYQWKWQYEYLDQGIRFFSNLSTPFDQIYQNAKKNQWYLLEVDNPLVVPVHQKIRFLVTANDVIHSWWVPDLGIKRDAIPGFIHESWVVIDKPGIYRGQCAELCGVNHGFMPIVVKAVSEKAFEEWAAAQPKVGVRAAAEAKSKPSSTPIVKASEKEIEAPMTAQALGALGKVQYEKYCLVCHRADGTGMPPVFPALKGSSVAVGRPISRHIKMILNGVPGTAMQAFAEQLSDKEIAAIVTYERNAWGNNTGDVVQPADVTAVRLGKAEDAALDNAAASTKNNPDNEKLVTPKEEVKP